MSHEIKVNETIRLTQFDPSDKPNLLLYMNDETLYNNTLKVPQPYLEKDADEWFVFVKEQYEISGSVTNWAVRHHTAGVIGGIGRFGLGGLESHCDEIGYWLAAPYRGCGLMTEVVSTYCDWLFAHTPLVRIEAGVFAHNPASKRVLEKAGFEQEGFARKKHCKKGVLVDAFLMARLKGE